MRNNPYNPDQSAIPERFFGRSKIIEPMVNRLLSSSGQSFAALGGRRIGKTSLLVKINDELLLKTQQSSYIKVIPVLISLNEIIPKSMSDFIHAIADKTYNAIKEQSSSIISDKPTSEIYTWSDILDILGLIQNYSTGKEIWRIVWLFDELEVIRDETWRDDIYFKIRHLISDHELRKFISIVVATVRYQHLDATKEGSSLLNVLSTKLLHNLSVNAAENLVKMPLNGDSLNNDMIESLIQITGRNPHFIQYFMRELCDRFEILQDITQQDLNNLINEYYDDRGLRFENWIKKYFNTDERSIITYLLKSGNRLFDEKTIKQDLRTIDGIDTFKINESIKYLVSSGILNKNDKKYEFAGNVMLKCLNFLHA